MSKHLREDAALALGATCVLSAETAHHARVSGLAASGATFDVVDADGRRWRVEVTATEPVTVRVVGEAPALGADPTVALTVWVPTLKAGRTDDVLRQLTELGAARVVVWEGRRSVARLPDGKGLRQRAERWERILRSATEQCGRTDVPELVTGARLEDAGPQGVVFTLLGGEPARDVLRAAPSPLSILVGPEGGLHPDELATLRSLGWRAAWLGGRVLRADTAVLAAATLALHGMGEAGY